MIWLNDETCTFTSYLCPTFLLYVFVEAFDMHKQNSKYLSGSSVKQNFQFPCIFKFIKNVRIYITDAITRREDISWQNFPSSKVWQKKQPS